MYPSVVKYWVWPDQRDQVLSIVDQLLNAPARKPGPVFRAVATRIVEERIAVLDVLRARGVDAETVAAVERLGC
jgi:hypothetical protein